MLEIEGDDGLSLPILRPEVARDRAVVMIVLAIASPPLVEPLSVDADPFDQTRGGQAGPLRVAANRIDDLVTATAVFSLVPEVLAARKDELCSNGT